MPQIGAQTMQALSSVKDPAVHAVIESEALHQMSQSFTKGSEWQSTAVHTEVLLQHVLEASAHLPVPNRFRTESVCALLHTQIGALGRYEPILRQLQADIYASIFEGVSEARNGAVLHGKPYFEVARELQNKACCSYVTHALRWPVQTAMPRTTSTTSDHSALALHGAGERIDGGARGLAAGATRAAQPH